MEGLGLAKQHAANSSAVEQALIEALRQRYTNPHYQLLSVPAWKLVLLDSGPCARSSKEEDSGMIEIGWGGGYLAEGAEDIGLPDRESCLGGTPVGSLPSRTASRAPSSTASVPAYPLRFVFVKPGEPRDLDALRRAAIRLSGGLETRIDGFVERLEEGRPDQLGRT